VNCNIKMQTKLPLCDSYRFAVFKECLHDECAMLRAPLLHGNYKTLRFQCYPSHGNWTLRLHILAVQKTSDFTGGPYIYFIRQYCKCLEQNIQVHQQNTRSKLDFHVKMKKTEIYRKSVIKYGHESI
jgi:hypothetical protein